MTSLQTISSSFLHKRGVFILQLIFTLLICGVAVSQTRELFSSEQIGSVVIDAFGHRSYLILLMLLFGVLNWAMEALKWLVVVPNENQMTFLQSLRSVLIGLGASLLMPRIAGESIGRYSSHLGDKKDVLAALFLTKVTQTIVTFLFGVLGVYYFKSVLFSWIETPNYWLIGGVLLLASVILFFGKMIIKIVLTSVYFKSFRQMTIKKALDLFFYSLLRYFTFFLQFYIMTVFVDVVVDPIDLFFGLAALYFLRMATVSINIVVDLGVRFATGLFVFTALGLFVNVHIVLTIFSLVWLFNVILPSLVGGLLILKKR